MPAHLNLHAVLTRTRSNGPGTRTAYWLQGCSLGCPGCFNPETHSPEQRLVVCVEEILRDLIERAPTIEGITVTGGEPLDQAPAVRELLRGVRAFTSLTVVLFSGHTFENLAGLPEGPEIMSLVDVLISGPYLSSCSEPGSFPGSRNQRIEFITDAYAFPDFAAMPQAEVIIDRTGTVVLTGAVPPDMQVSLRFRTEQSGCAEFRARRLPSRATRINAS